MAQSALAASKIDSHCRTVAYQSTKRTYAKPHIVKLNDENLWLSVGKLTQILRCLVSSSVSGETEGTLKDPAMSPSSSDIQLVLWVIGEVDAAVVALRGAIPPTGGSQSSRLCRC